MKKRVFIIAEAGVNHNGSLEQAKVMVNAAADAGVDAVKFQAFRATHLVTRTAKKAIYQKKPKDTSEWQYDMLKNLELSPQDFRLLKTYCENKDLGFLVAPFDHQSIDDLKELGLEKWKLPSGEVTNLPYLRRIGAFNQEVILSTGMCYLEDVSTALSILETAGTSPDKISLLHCHTDYPTHMRDANLLAIRTLQDAFPDVQSIGYSDHTLGIEAAIAAVAIGASIIEKHFTLDCTLPGPDHRASLEPDALTEMVRAIRNIELAMGSGEKEPSSSELQTIAAVRKSIVAERHIATGEMFSELNLSVKRPGTGLSPMRWDEVVGTPAARDYQKDELIDA